MSGERALQEARLSRGGLRCHGCGKHVNRRTMWYKPVKYATGRVEYVPVCQLCNGGASQ